MQSLDKNISIKLPENNVGRMVETLIGCKWSLSVLKLLRAGVNRPGEMQRRVDGLTAKVLNERLTKLLKYGIIHKTVYPEAPPRVTYAFTAFGTRFLEIIDVIEKVQNELSDTPHKA